MSAPDLGLDLRDTQGDAWVRLDGGTISLENLELEKGTVLALTYSGDELSLFISGKPIRGTLAISGNGKLTAGTRAGEPSLTRTYQIGDGPPDPGQVPLHIALHAPRSWALGRLALNNLNFLVEETRNVPEADFVSGIVSGTLTFNDVPWQPLTISEGDVLTIRDAGRAPVEIRGDKGIIQVTRSGVAGQVTLGLGEAKRQLAPSYLEYLYNQKKLSFFWGSAVGIWGVLWGIRKTIFR